MRPLPMYVCSLAAISMRSTNIDGYIDMTVVTSINESPTIVQIMAITGINVHIWHSIQRLSVQSFTNPSPFDLEGFLRWERSTGLMTRQGTPTSTHTRLSPWRATWADLRRRPFLVSELEEAKPTRRQPGRHPRTLSQRPAAERRLSQETQMTPAACPPPNAAVRISRTPGTSAHTESTGSLVGGAGLRKRRSWSRP